jgi:hypothetical protein
MVMVCLWCCVWSVGLLMVLLVLMVLMVIFYCVFVILVNFGSLPTRCVVWTVSVHVCVAFALCIRYIFT